MDILKINTDLLSNYISTNDKNIYKDAVRSAHSKMHAGTSVGADYLGWLELPLDDQDLLLDSIGKIANEIQSRSSVFIVIGVGGSYLGTKAVHDALKPYFGSDSVYPEIMYAGQNMSGAYLKQLLRYIEDKEVFINVISKSGTTTEPAIAFRVLRSYMEERYGEEANDRIVVTTDSEKGALKELANEKGYRSFVIPDDIGGRYSVLTPVGLLPLAVAGLDIRALLAGAKQATLDLLEDDLESNSAYRYAVARQVLYAKGYTIELLASFEPSLKYLHEWWKQLFGESEGKGLQGIFPAAVSFSTDLHSIGQYIQDGRRDLFETLLHFNDVEDDQQIPYDSDDRDGLNYLVDRTLNEINAISKEGTALAHSEGGVPVLKIELAKLDEFHLGYLIYFFMKACAMSAYLSGVNPFDQPGVEAYKNKMFELLGKLVLSEQEV
ncbi:glucose-6-phosphate isomerase [Sporosarcina sp. G11-34]|uniref:glucose-6-phosphate isomerase n=1 Tax=Sporosarcina sp. G11-34 TaxID=2849605 RepID=UPI0022A94041|nr:glucose-6-phosphate isomerase [Sporosarcina sp. G11-34]MCZ2257308.1 glucose-6-phosphate isomerase [Sporosarcina sp. G11-34]